MSALLKTLLGDSLSCGLGCASKRGGKGNDLRKTPGLVDAPRQNGEPVDGSDEALAQSEALISLIETAISRRSDKLKEQGASDEVAPGATNSIAGLIQSTDVDGALRDRNGAAGPSNRPPPLASKPPAANGQSVARGEYEYEYYDAPGGGAPAEDGGEYEYSYSYASRGSSAAAAVQEDAVLQGLSTDEYEYYYEDGPAPAPAAARE